MNIIPHVDVHADILKLYSPVLVGQERENGYFKKYFKKILSLTNNQQALKYFYKKKPSIIFLYCDKYIVDIVKKIREHDRKTILIVLFEDTDMRSLLKLLPFHFSGYIEKPFKEEKVKKVLENIVYDLNFLNEDFCTLSKNYCFDKKEKILYNSYYKEIKLTKNETKLMNILSQKHHYFTSEFIEYTIWEDDSTFEDCNQRLKALLYGLRKKLPEDSIVNTYNLGYKLMFS